MYIPGSPGGSYVGWLLDVPVCAALRSSDKRSMKTVGDIFTCLLCFHRFAVAASSFHTGKGSQFMAYANTILQAHLEFEGDGWRAYNRAFQLQVSVQPREDWLVLNLPFTCLFTAQSYSWNTCCYCSGRDHFLVHFPCWGRCDSYTRDSRQGNWG